MSDAAREVSVLRQASREVVRELGLLRGRFEQATTAQCHALVELERHAELTSGALADLLGVDKSAASRTASEIVRRGWAKVAESGADKRRKPLVLTRAGKRELGRIHRAANERVGEALALLGESERARVVEGMALYARALAKSRARSALSVRRIKKQDDPGVARLIRTVMPEFGASGPGFAILDPEVDCMHRTYTRPRSAYWVVVRGDDVVGGAGYGPLAGASERVCELRKMYFLPETRGLGLGAELLELCLEHARQGGYERCYLETLAHMDRARRLYESFGFRRLKRPQGATGHFGCDVWYSRRL